MKNPIIEFRKSKNYSRKEFAVILEVPYSTLSQVENIHNTSYENVINKIDEIFNIDKKQLIEDYEDFLNKYREELLRGID